MIQPTRQHIYEPQEIASRLIPCLETMRARLIYFCEPDRAIKHWQYKGTLDRNWLGSFLSSDMRGEHLSQLPTNPKIGNDVFQEYHAIADAARHCSLTNIKWLNEQFHVSLKNVVLPYCSKYWIDAIKDGLPHELWHVLSGRDTIESHFQAHRLLHSQLVPEPTLVENVKLTDQLLRTIGSELWGIDPPTSSDDKSRELENSVEHWWWWLDRQ